MPLFLREVSAKHYSIGSYLFARTLAEQPVQIFAPAIYSTIVFFLAKLRPIDHVVDVGHFFLAVLAVVLTGNASASLGYAVGAAFQTPQVTRIHVDGVAQALFQYRAQRPHSHFSHQVAIIVGAAILLPLVIFGGYLLNSEDVPPYWLWLEVQSATK